MPAKPVWLLRVPEIISEVRSLAGAAVIDRAAFERLFGVRRRRAIDLMQQVGGFQCGRTHILQREELLSWLERVQAGDGFKAEQRRKQKVAEQINELHRRRGAANIHIPVLPQIRTELPAGISLRPGEMAVSFTTTEDLLARLYAIATAAADDFDSFTAIIEGVPTGNTAG